jgi:glycosyltransferase involved in cell wall biosynthesis
MTDLHTHLMNDPTARADAQPVVLDARVVTGVGGGPDKTILNSPRFLRAAGYRMLCAYLHPPDDPGFATLRQRAHDLEAPLQSIPDRGPFDARVLRHLARICRENRVTIWHGHDYKSNVLGLLLQPFWPMRLVTTVHGWGVRGGRRGFYYQIDRLSLRFYEKVLCVSEDLRRECLVAGVAEENCLLLENGIDTNDYARRSNARDAKHQLGIPADRVAIGAVGRLSAEKGFDNLLRAVGLLVREGLDVHLVIVGEGEERPRLEALVDELGLQNRVLLTGYYSDPRTAYATFDVYALSSLREGLPNALLEAMAMGIAVVATRIAGVPDLIKHEHNGLLIPPTELGALADALRRLVLQPQLRSRLAGAGRRTVVESCSFAHRMDKLAQIYDSMLCRRPRQNRQTEVVNGTSAWTS